MDNTSALALVQTKLEELPIVVSSRTPKPHLS